jgi:hypothetical protein
MFGRETNKYTVIYGVYTWFWPTICICMVLTNPRHGLALPKREGGTKPTTGVTDRKCFDSTGGIVATT